MAAGDSDRLSEAAAVLRRSVRGQVDTSSRRRAEYSSDASNYRVVPQAVVFPVDVEDLLAVTGVARELGLPLTLRGGGTSVAGNAVGPGVVVDTSRHLTRILALDPDTRSATVQPGVVLSSLQAAARPHGLRMGPDPSTQARATLGGMIGNNACGPRSVAHGRTADSVLALDVVDGAGRRFTAGRGLRPVPGLRRLVAGSQGLLRAELGRFSRQVSGYGLEHLLPEHGEHLARALVGSEGTVATVLSATLQLVEVPAATALLVLGYPDMATAAEAVPALTALAPRALEGMDGRLVEVVRQHRGPSGVPVLPDGGGWLLVELAGASPDEALAAARAAGAVAGTPAIRVLPAGAEAAALWRIREDGAGLSGRTAAGAQTWPGWEDSAVPPAHLPAYLRELDALMAAHGLQGAPYGHFAEGCVHLRIDLPLAADPAALRRFVTAAAGLVAGHGGSLSGEHGDGRARSELLPLMYSPEALGAFEAFKGLLDPDDLLNPGVLVHPRPVDADLRRPAARPLPRADGFAYAADGGDFTTAVHRCVGLGKCRADSSAAGGVMCPSFLATRDERDSTRGRARVLQEMANGTLVTGGWRAREVADVLDLCLSCRACARDCPAEVDMARYKAEVLHRRYRRRLRPVTHYTLGWLPRWARLAALAPGAVNVLLDAGALGRLLRSAAGLDPRRRPPAFAVASARRPAATRPAVSRGGAERIVLWEDTFTRAFAPQVFDAAAVVLQNAGYGVEPTPPGVCCALTWISTGQLAGARRRLRRLVDALAPHAEAGRAIVGLEPSCTAVLRADLTELLPGDARAAAVAAATRTLAEVLTAAPPLGPGDWSLPHLGGTRVLAQPHCHQHAVMGYDADLRLLEATGATVTTVAGCCGLAGNFGMEKGHYEVSVRVAEAGLLPAVEAAPPGTSLLADGFSCRLQAEQLAGAPSRHLAELLADGLRGDPGR